MSSGVEFEEGGYSGGGYVPGGFRSPRSTPGSSPVYAFLIRVGLAKDDAGARKASVVISLLLIVGSALILYFFVFARGAALEETRREYPPGSSALR